MVYPACILKSKDLGQDIDIGVVLAKVFTICKGFVISKVSYNLFYSSGKFILFFEVDT